MKEEQATAESSSECQVSIHGGGGRDRSAIQVQEKQEEQLKELRGSWCLLALLTTMSADSRGKQLVASLNLVINSKQKKVNCQKQQ